MIRPTLGARLRKLREKHDVNLRDLGEATGVDHSLIAKYENGRRTLSEETFEHLRAGIEDAQKLAQYKSNQKNAAKKVLLAMAPKRGALHDALMPDAPRGALHESLGLPDSALGRAVATYQPRAAISPELVSAIVNYVGALQDGNEALAEMLVKSREDQARKLAALENLESVSDPIVSELIESFRREIEEKDQLIQAMNSELEKERSAGKVK